MTTTSAFSQRLIRSFQWVTCLALIVLLLTFWTTERHPWLLRHSSYGFAFGSSLSSDDPDRAGIADETDADHVLPFRVQDRSTFRTGGGPPVVDLAAPPMGFMSWERFMCEIDCQRHPHECINEDLYTSMADAMVEGGYVQAGYNRVDIDDCWAVKDHRDPVTSRLLPDPKRFPRGMRYLADYLHDRGMLFGTYSDVGTHTCGGYPGSKDYEAVDAQTFADWGVDYLKLDGCWMALEDMPEYYTKWGNELKRVATQQEIVFSCSWPAYLGDNETSKPFAEMYGQAGCNTWRNWADIDNSWPSLKGIMMHWAKYWKVLRDNQHGGGFHDADMLLVGDDHHGKRLSVEQARVQMGFWALIASPLFIGGDVRTIPDEYRRILLNHDIIAVHQDAERHMGACISGCHPHVDEQQVWRRDLNSANSIALGFFNLNEDEASNVAGVRFSLPKRQVSKCLDLWAPGGSLINLCPTTQTIKTATWEINIGRDAYKAYSIQVTAHDMAPMSHRMLRLDLEPFEEITSSIG